MKSVTFEGEEQIKRVARNTSETDDRVHKLIHSLLILGEQENNYKHMSKEGAVRHQECIIAVKDRIKPGMVSIACSKYTIEMVKKYFHHLI